MVIFFVFLIVGTQVALRFWQLDLDKREKAFKNDPLFAGSFPITFKLLLVAPAAVTTFLMITYEQIFKRVVFYMIDLENHRYNNSYENNLAQLYFVF